MPGELGGAAFRVTLPGYAGADPSTAAWAEVAAPADNAKEGPDRNRMSKPALPVPSPLPGNRQ